MIVGICTVICCFALIGYTHLAISKLATSYQLLNVCDP